MRDWLKTLRNEKGLTMKDVGEQLGISESYYSMVEAGERQKKMDLTVASGLSTIFGLSVSDIVDLEQAWQSEQEEAR